MPATQERRRLRVAKGTQQDGTATEWLPYEAVIKALGHLSGFFKAIAEPIVERMVTERMAGMAANQWRGKTVLRRREAAEYIGVSEPTFTRLVSAGKIKKIKTGPRSAGYLVEELDRYLRENEDT